MVVYVTVQGARIVREGGHLLVKKERDTYHTLFVKKLKQVVICGNVTLTHGAGSLLMRNGVDTVFLRRDGRYLGRFATPEPKNVELRRRQFLLLDDSDFTLSFARAVVAGKLASMASLLMRISRTRKKKVAAVQAKSIRQLVLQVERAGSLESLRGYEGRGAAIYFGTLAMGLDHNPGFHRRVRRPPTDPVNAVLSLVYTFLFNRVYAAVRLANLDPYPGILHVADYGRHSLVMDLMEEFRVIIGDTLTLALFNLKILQEKDFRIVQDQASVTGEGEAVGAPPTVSDATDPYGLESLPEDGSLMDLPPQRMHENPGPAREEDTRGRLPVLLRTEAMKRVIENFERKMETKIYYDREEQRLSYNEVLVAQAAQFRRLVEGKTKVYEPMVLR